MYRSHAVAPYVLRLDLHEEEFAVWNSEFCSIMLRAFSGTRHRSFTLMLRLRCADVQMCRCADVQMDTRGLYPTRESLDSTWGIDLKLFDTSNDMSFLYREQKRIT